MSPPDNLFLFWWLVWTSCWLMSSTICSSCCPRIEHNNVDESNLASSFLNSTSGCFQYCFAMLNEDISSLICKYCMLFAFFPSIILPIPDSYNLQSESVWYWIKRSRLSLTLAISTAPNEFCQLAMFASRWKQKGEQNKAQEWNMSVFVSREYKSIIYLRKEGDNASLIWDTQQQLGANQIKPSKHEQCLCEWESTE